jgi:CMP-N,N'-diacetyllegionaminic acid synthase
MIRGKTVLAIIPARGGSKGVPRKNIRELAGKPLIAWTIEAAKQSAYIDRLIVSTDDWEIAEVAKRYGCEVPFLRPRELAKDDTPGIAPILHALETLPSYDLVVLLQPTSPLRTTADIDGCIEKCVSKQANACVSVTVADKTPYWMYLLSSSDTLEPVIPGGQTVLRRQDAAPVYVLNGAVYVACADWLVQSKSFLEKETIGYVMPVERSIDIDNELDFYLAETIMNYSAMTSVKK